MGHGLGSTLLMLPSPTAAVPRRASPPPPVECMCSVLSACKEGVVESLPCYTSLLVAFLIIVCAVSYLFCIVCISEIKKLFLDFERVRYTIGGKNDPYTSIHEQNKRVYFSLIRGCDGELLPITLA